MITIVLVGLFVRLPFYVAFRPIWSGDSRTYSVAFHLWSRHKFSIADRTPAYPLFLGLAEWVANVPFNTVLVPRAAYVAVILQSALDIAAAVFLYFGLQILGVKRRAAFFSALFAVTIPALCWFEMNILNLSFSFFWLTIAATCLAATMKSLAEERPFVGRALLTGGAFAVAGLTRPENLVFTAALICFLVLASPRIRLERRRVAVASGYIAGVVIVPLLLWMTCNYVGIGEFRVTTLTGWNRSKTVYNAFNLVQPRDKVLGEILSRSYRKRNLGNEVIRDHFWEAVPELFARYQEMPIQDPTEPRSTAHRAIDRVVSRITRMDIEVPCDGVQEACTESLRNVINMGDYVGSVSSKLIEQHPDIYLLNVADNFARDTFNFSYLNTTTAVEGFSSTTSNGTEAVQDGRVERFIRFAVSAEAPLLCVTYILTLCCAFLLPLILLRLNQEFSISDLTVMALAVATCATFLAICALAGFNREYSSPHLGVLILCSTCLLSRICQKAPAPEQ